MDKVTEQALDMVMLEELWEHDSDIYCDKIEEFKYKWAGK